MTQSPRGKSPEGKQINQRGSSLSERHIYPKAPLLNVSHSYVHYLETRNAYLESLLVQHQISFHPPDHFDLPPPPTLNTSIVAASPASSIRSPTTPATTVGERSPIIQKRQRPSEEGGDSDGSSSDSQGRLNKLVSDIGLVSVQGASDPRYLGTVSGISFARVVFAAVKSAGGSNHHNGKGKGNGSGSHSNGIVGGDSDPVGGTNSGKEDTAMRDSFFGLATNRKRVRPAKWPSRQLASRLINLYFGHANPQLPILHKVEFEAMVDHVYANRKRREGGEAEGTPKRNVGARELYMMNIVFAIGAGIFLENDNGNSSSSGSSDDELRQRKKKKSRSSKAGSIDGEVAPYNDYKLPVGESLESPRATKKPRINGDGDDTANHSLPAASYGSEDGGEDDDVTEGPRFDGQKEERQYPPEAYHAAALPYLEKFLSSESKGGVEELQAVLLLAGYALLRPVAPGLWYIVGVAVRLAVDLGLHFEDSSSTEDSLSGNADQDLRGRWEWVRDLRRRLWWCTYSLDRLVSTCVGRPFGIQDEVVSTRVS